MVPGRTTNLPAKQSRRPTDTPTLSVKPFRRFDPAEVEALAPCDS